MVQEKKIRTTIVIFAILITCSAAIIFFNRPEKEWTYRDPSIYGMIPDESTAIKISEIIWLQVYGNSIDKHKPFKATLNGDIWTVHGTKHSGDFGGVPALEINKSTGCIIRVFHTK
jgi:hypothetical protein